MLLVSIFFVVLIDIHASAAQSNNILCYYLNNNGAKLLPPEHIDPHLCTHIIYSFLDFNDYTGTLKFNNPHIDLKLKMIYRVIHLREENPKLKILVSVGGGSVSSKRFSAVVADPKKRRELVESSVFLLRKYDLDGMDIDWEKPYEKDKENYVTFLKELKEEFVKNNWILTAAVFPNPDMGYNVTEMIKYVDFLNLMCYNYYGPWSAYTGQNSALFPSPIESNYEKRHLNVAVSVANWMLAGAPREKIIVGLAFYGRQFTLANPSEHGLHAPINGTGTVSTPSYRTIKKNYKRWAEVWDYNQMNPYKYENDQWVGYEDEKSIETKGQFICREQLGGAMIWHLGHDDVDGAFGPKQGLLRIVHDKLIPKSTTPVETSTGPITTTTATSAATTITILPTTVATTAAAIIKEYKVLLSICITNCM